MSDVFGDLRNRDEALATLERLRADRQLDRHQQGLARLVRYREDPHLQQAALESALEIGSSSDLLLADALNTLVCHETPLHLRVAAAQATGHLLSCYGRNGWSQFDVRRAYQTLQHVAARQHPPPLEHALRHALNQAESHIVGGPKT